MSTVPLSGHQIPQASSQKLEAEVTAMEGTATDITSWSLYPLRLQRPMAWRRGNTQPCPRAESKFLFKSRGCDPLRGFIFWPNPELKAKWTHTANLTPRLTQPPRDSINDHIKTAERRGSSEEPTGRLFSAAFLLVPHTALCMTNSGSEFTCVIIHNRQSGKLPKCVSADEWINKLWCICGIQWNIIQS